jgi:hypothetical protein
MTTLLASISQKDSTTEEWRSSKEVRSTLLDCLTLVGKLHEKSEGILSQEQRVPLALAHFQLLLMLHASSDIASYMHVREIVEEMPPLEFLDDDWHLGPADDDAVANSN